MKVLITGGAGQLGTELAQLLRRTDEVHAYDRAALNVQDEEQVYAAIRTLQPDVIIHCAAYTQVDQAETDRDRAFAVNAVGARNIAAAAARHGAKLAYISTDYVFNGDKGEPYHEFDRPEPTTVYGLSKLHGERFVRDLHSEFYIVRTSWLYGRGANNFIGKIVQAARSGQALKVVVDEIGSPTYTGDLADFLSALIRTTRYGVYHASNAGYCSRYELAAAALKVLDIADVHVQPISAMDLSRPARRPRNSAMDHMMIRLNGLPDLPAWQDGLSRCLEESQAK